MKYKGYIGKVELDDEAGLFHGEIINTRDVITFQGQSVSELTKAFHDSVDDYLAFCKQRGEAPDKPFSGQFVTRIPPELHRQVNVAACMIGKSLNAFVTEQLEAAVQQVDGTKSSGKKVATKAKNGPSGTKRATKGKAAKKSAKRKQRV